jgi:hypothetical protein
VPRNPLGVGDENLANVLPQESLQFLPLTNSNHVGDVGCVESRSDLGVEINAVHHYEDGGIAQLGMEKLVVLFVF